MYVVESIEDIRKKKTKTEFKVKWLGFENSDCTWEPEDSISKFIREYYKDASKLRLNCLFCYKAFQDTERWLQVPSAELGKQKGRTMVKPRLV